MVMVCCRPSTSTSITSYCTSPFSQRTKLRPKNVEISPCGRLARSRSLPCGSRRKINAVARPGDRRWARSDATSARSEEHTSELQSLMRISYAVFCLKKKNNNEKHTLATSKSMTHNKNSKYESEA